MKLKDIYKKNISEPIISYEVFPPKGDGEEYRTKVNDLLDELHILKQFNPSMISVTYGAGGSTQDKTLELISVIKNNLDIDTMPHFTCVNANKKFILDYIKKIEEKDIENILALRGDPPLGAENFTPCEDGFQYANELVSFIKKNSNLSIAVAGYPTKHPEATTREDDISNLIKKIHAGADIIYTQMFFDNKKYFDLCKRLWQKNVAVPVIPGIMIIQSISQIERIIKLSGIKLPDELNKELITHKDNKEKIKQIGIEFAQNQVKELLNFGVKGLHFFPLNKSYSTTKVLKNIL